MSSSKALHPQPLSILRREAAGDAIVRNDEEVGPLDNRRWYVGRAAVGPPGDVGLRDVAFSIRTNRQDVPLRKTSCNEEKLAVVDHRGHELFCRSIHDPVAPAGGGVVARDRFAAGEHHLGAAGDFTDDGGDVAAGLVLALDPPAFLTGFAFKSDNVGVSIMIPVDDDEILVEDRAGVEAVGADELSDFRLPLQLSIEIIGDDEDGAGGDGTRGADVGRRDRAAIDLEEGRVDQLAIGGGSAGGAAVESMDGLERGLEDCLSPADGAVVAVETEQYPFCLLYTSPSPRDLSTSRMPSSA